jgi:hypothetical protein
MTKSSYPTVIRLWNWSMLPGWQDGTLNVGDACCGNTPYTILNSSCCDGTVRTLPFLNVGEEAKCCGTDVYNSGIEVCCPDGTFNLGYACCGNTPTDSSDTVCCPDGPSGAGDLCCGNTPYDTANDICCDGTPVALPNLP